MAETKTTITEEVKNEIPRAVTQNSIPLIHCVGKAGVASVFDQGEVGAGAVAAGLFQTFIGGTVVHHDQVKILFGLGVDGLDGVLQPALAVDVWDNDGRFYHKSYSCFRQLQREYIILSQKCKPLG